MTRYEELIYPADLIRSAYLLGKFHADNRSITIEQFLSINMDVIADRPNGSDPDTL